jgi:hypothetical protein
VCHLILDKAPKFLSGFEVEDGDHCWKFGQAQHETHAFPRHGK